MLLKKSIRGNNDKALKDKVAERIAFFLLSMQSRFADFLNSKTKTLNIKIKRLWLAVFCILFGGFSIYAFIGAFEGNEKEIRFSEVSVPKYYDQTGAEMKGPKVSEKDITIINRFDKYMDSLHRAPGGKVVYDSILKTRRGLMDSIQAIKQIYYSQSK